MDPNFKDSSRDSAIKRLVCYTVWHSSFNGFMAVQTQLGRFQNGTHLFFLLFPWDCDLDKRLSGNDQLYWILPDGDAQDSRSFGAFLCFYLGTFRPLLLCRAHPKGEWAIKPTASFKPSDRPLDEDYIKLHLNMSAKNNQLLAQKSHLMKHNVTSVCHLSYFYPVISPGLQQKDKTPAHCCLHTLQSLQVTSRWRHCSTTSSQTSSCNTPS